MPPAAKKAGIEVKTPLNFVMATCKEWEKKLPKKMREKLIAENICATDEETKDFMARNDVLFRTNTRRYVANKGRKETLTEN